MTASPATRRLHCPTCGRPKRTCICQWIAPVAHVVEVLILQHPLEVDHAKGSARLLHLSLPRSRLVAGETFPEDELQALLHAPYCQPQASGAQIRGTVRHPVLLYPESAEGPSSALSAPGLCEQRSRLLPTQLRLVVLDATWRKSRKMLHLNPLLQQLPRLALRDIPPSRYLIRKAHKPHQLSTLEATCLALMRLERNDERYLPLLTAFQGFVEQQAGYLPIAR